MSPRPRWLRKQDRYRAGQLERTHDLIDRVWVDQYQLMRRFDVLSSVERAQVRVAVPDEAPRLRVIPGGAS